MMTQNSDNALDRVFPKYLEVYLKRSLTFIALFKKEGFFSF